jgi:hypothetical protein
VESEKVWTELAEGSGVLTADYRVPGLVSRSYALRLADGGFAIVSPGSTLVDAFADEHPDVEVRFLVASSNFHWMGVPAWRERFPRAEVVASPGARARLEKKGVHPTVGLEGLSAALPPHLDVFEMPGTRSGETWVRAETGEGVAWLVCDAFFNMRRPKRRRSRLTQRLMRSGPGLAISHLMKWGGLRDRRAAKRWLLERLEADAPTILVPAHGDVVRDPGLPGRLRALIEDRL